MSKITRRAFVGLLALVAPAAGMFGWVRQSTAARAIAGHWRSFHRWRHGIQPRPVDWSSTSYFLFHDDGIPAFKRTDVWREWRWPDNDELVSRGATASTTEPVLPRMRSPIFVPGTKLVDRIEQCADIWATQPRNHACNCDVCAWYKACGETVERLKRDAMPMTEQEQKLFAAVLDGIDPNDPAGELARERSDKRIKWWAEKA